LDLDGTLADSMQVMTAATDRFLGELGVSRMGGGPHRWAGRSPYDIMGALKQHHGLKPSVDELVERYYTLVNQTYTEQSAVMPGGRELLSAAAQRGVFTAVVTSTLRSVAEGFLAHQGLAGLVNAVVSVEDITQGKPNPEPYLLALEISGLPAEEVLAVEDAPMGAVSATRAGLATWVMAPRGHDDFPDIPGVAGFISSLDQLIPRLAPCQLGEPGLC